MTEQELTRAVRAGIILGIGDLIRAGAFVARKHANTSDPRDVLEAVDKAIGELMATTEKVAPR
jgi:hypothetical protein